MKKILSVILAIIQLLLMVACGSSPKQNSTPGIFADSTATINLNDYISVEFSGNNFDGSAQVIFDEEKFLLDHIENVSFNEKNYQVYKELYPNRGKTAATEVLRFISCKLNKYHGLSNGDTVELVWQVETDKIENYFVLDYSCSSQSFAVTGLGDNSFDPFENVIVSFYGAEPYIQAIVEKHGHNYGGEYIVSPNENLKIGDTVTVTYSCPDKATMLATYGKYPAYYEKTYIITEITSENKVVVSVSGFISFSGSLSGNLQNGDIVQIWVRRVGSGADGTAFVPIELQWVKVVTTTTGDDIDKDQIVVNEDGSFSMPSTVTFVLDTRQVARLAEYSGHDIHLTLVYRGNEETAQKYLDMQDEVLNS